MVGTGIDRRKGIDRVIAQRDCRAQHIARPADASGRATARVRAAVIGEDAAGCCHSRRRFGHRQRCSQRRISKRCRDRSHIARIISHCGAGERAAVIAIDVCDVVSRNERGFE